MLIYQHVMLFKTLNHHNNKMHEFVLLWFYKDE